MSPCPARRPRPAASTPTSATGSAARSAAPPGSARWRPPVSSRPRWPAAVPTSGKLAAGAIGVGLFFAFWSWVGFEMAPNYGEESRNAKKNIGRAMYISVIGLGVFYNLTSWASLAGYPSANAAIASAQGDPANFFFTPSTQYAGHWVTSVMSYLIITGSFACRMAFHNTTARYTYSLGRAGMLPPVLGKTHPRW